MHVLILNMIQNWYILNIDNPYITHNLLKKRLSLYNYMIYTSQLCLALDDGLKLNYIVIITFRVIASASETGLWNNNQEKQ